MRKKDKKIVPSQNIAHVSPITISWIKSLWVWGFHTIWRYGANFSFISKLYFHGVRGLENSHLEWCELCYSLWDSSEIGFQEGFCLATISPLPFCAVFRTCALPHSLTENLSIGLKTNFLISFPSFSPHFSSTLASVIPINVYFDTYAPQLRLALTFISYICCRVSNKRLHLASQLGTLAEYLY